MNVDVIGMEKVCEGIYKKSNTTYYILCSVSKAPCFCSAERLEKLTAKHGSLDKLAANYVSRDAKRLIKAKVPAKSVMKMDRESLREEADAVKRDRDVRREERKRHRVAKEAIRTQPVMKYEPRPPYSVTLDTPETIAEHTQSGCLYPNRFLDGGRTCNECSLHEHCVASVRKLSKKYKRVSV